VTPALFVAAILTVDGHAEVLANGHDLSFSLLLLDAYSRHRHTAAGSLFIWTMAPDYQDLGPVLRVKDGRWFVLGTSQAQAEAA